MSKLTLYNGIKADLEAITGIKHVTLWRNQLERENEEQPFLYPAIFVEFLPSNYQDKGNKAQSQQYDLTVRLHICFESYEDEDTTILTLVDSVWQAIHKKQYGTFGQLLRRNEEQNFDHSNIQDYIQDYATLGNDNKTNTLVSHTVTTLNTPSTIVSIGSGIGVMGIGSTFIIN
jgi:hypothetical protein